MGFSFDLKGRFESFIEEFTDEEGQLRYQEKIREMESTGARSLFVSYNDLLIQDPKLAEEILINPEETLTASKEVLQSKLAEISPDYLERLKQIHVRITDLSEKLMLRSLKTEHLGILTCFEGIVIGVTDAKPLLIRGHFRCASCGDDNQIVDFPEGIYTPPYQCRNEQCQRKGSLQLQLDKSIFIDWQKITLQEKPEELPPGQLPQNTYIHVLDDLVDQARPGDRVEIVGILKARTSRFLKRGQLATYGKFFHGSSITRETKEYVDIEISDEDELKIIDLSKSPYIIEKIRDSLAPSIYGHDHVKEAIASLLFGGRTKVTPDGMKLRGESNILVVGDPGTGKSQIMKFVSQLAPRALYTTGKGSTAAGLTAAVIRDQDTGEITLEAGALVLADQGIACLTGDSKILVENRLIKIKDLFTKKKSLKTLSNNEIVEISELSFNTISVNSELKTIPSISSRIRRKQYAGKIIEFIFNSGFRIELTPDHKLLNGNSLSWKEAAEFKKGESVIAPLKLPSKITPIYIFDIIPNDWLVILENQEKEELRKLVKTKYNSYSEFNKKYNITRDFLSGRSQIRIGILRKILNEFGIYKDWRLRCLKYGRKASGEILKVSMITPELAYYIGFIFGDGHVRISQRRSNVQITQSLVHMNQINNIKNMFSCFSQRNLGEYYRKTKGAIGEQEFEGESVILYSNSNLHAYIYSYFIEKGLRNLLQLPDESLKAFIAGCLDSDGCVSIKKGNKGGVVYENVHVEFLLSNDQDENETFLLALRRFDCYAKLIKHKSIDRIRITGRTDVKQLLDAVKQYSVKIKDIPLRKHLVSSTSGKIPMIPVALVSSQIFSQVKKTILLQRGIYSTLYAYKNQQYQPSRQQLLKIKNRVGEYLDDEILNQIDILTTRDYFLDQIIEINTRKINGFVYDCYIPQHHNFLCNGIIVHNCIDEFDKMRAEDRAAIHEAMEQHTISIAKAGIVATLNARTSILAAANPRRGRWNPFKGTADNLNLPPTILSRFDLIFVLEDKPDLKEDHDLATHILLLHKSQTLSTDPPIEQDLLRKYIAYARREIHPRLSDEAEERLLEYYKELRRSSGKMEEGHLDPIAITPRQLESLVRLSEARAKMRLSNEVTYDDASGAVNLMNVTLEKLAKDTETGKLDIDKYSSGISARSRRQLDQIDALIDKMLEEAEDEDPVAIKDIIDRAVEEGLNKNQVVKAIDEMTRRGIMFEPQQGFVKRP